MGVELISNDTEVEPDTVLELAKGRYAQVLVIGWDQKDELCWHSNMENQGASWLIDKFKKHLLDGGCMGDN